MDAILDGADGYATHDVLNQPGALHDVDLYTADRALVEAVGVFGATWAGGHLAEAGALAGSERVQHLARQANRHLPELRTHDRFGHRSDTVEFHPAYHALMGLIYGCRDALVCLDPRAARRAGRPRRALLPLEPGRERHLLPDGDDLRIHPGTSP